MDFSARTVDDTPETGSAKCAFAGQTSGELEFARMLEFDAARTHSKEAYACVASWDTSVTRRSYLC